MIISPSLLAANAGNYARDIKEIETAGAKYLHIDVMDGHFVPNLSFGPNILDGIRNESDLYLDVHLMVENPMDFIEPFSKAGAGGITVHAEAKGSIEEMQKICNELNVDFGIALRPQTNLESIEKYFSIIDLLLIMSINPGFGGQKFMPEAVNRIQKASELRKKHSGNFLISVDGGINEETGLLAARAGADILVTGSYLFKASDRRDAIKKLLV